MRGLVISAKYPKKMEPKMEDPKFAQPSELVEARGFVDSLFLDDITEYLKNDKELFPEGEKFNYINPMNERDEQWKEFLLELDKKTIVKVESLPEERKILAEKIAVDDIDARRISGRFVFPASVYNGLTRNEEELRLRNRMVF